MDYELAKKLKDAGFPQVPNYNSKGNLVGFGLYGKELKNENWGVITSVPALSELIEVCGDRFGSLSLFHGGEGWIAESFEDGGIVSVKTDFYKTPEEAVANLWLELNKK